MRKFKNQKHKFGSRGVFLSDLEKFTLSVKNKRSDNKTYLSKWTSLRALTSTLWPWDVIWRLKTLIFARSRGMKRPSWSP